MWFRFMNRIFKSTCFRGINKHDDGQVHKKEYTVNDYYIDIFSI